MVRQINKTALGEEGREEEDMKTDYQPPIHPPGCRSFHQGVRWAVRSRGGCVLLWSLCPAQGFLYIQ